MFIHFSIIMISLKKKVINLIKIHMIFFHNIENNLRELGFGDVTVNKKMKEFNKILYDILLKINKGKNEKNFEMNFKLISKYFEI